MPGDICSLAIMASLARGKKTGNLLLLPLFLSFFASAVNFSPPKYSACHSKHFGYDGTVCVCSDELECDSLAKVVPCLTGNMLFIQAQKQVIASV